MTAPISVAAAATRMPRSAPATKDRLVEAIAACLRRPPGDAAPIQTAMLVWQQLHGLVSLRISRPLFPWPPLADTVTDAVDRLLAGAHADADDHQPPRARADTDDQQAAEASADVGTQVQ